MAEREKADKELQEKALRLEKERSEKAIVDKIELEKVYITRKFDLLLAQVDEEEEGRSVRSRRSSSKSVEKVQAWIDNQQVTLNSKSGGRIPTGITSQQRGSSIQRIDTAAPIQNPEPQHHRTGRNDISTIGDQSAAAMNQLPSELMNMISPFSSTNLGPSTSAAPLLPTCQSTPFVAPLAASQRNQPDDVDVTHEDPHNRTYSVEIGTGNPLEVEQGLNVRSGSAPVSTPNSHVRIVTDTN